MVRSFRRGALAAVLALTLAPLAAACAAGNNATTLQVKNNAPAGTAGVMKVQNAFVLTQPGGPATVTARVFNGGTSSQTLQSVQVAGSLNARLTGRHGAHRIVIPPNGSVLLGGKGNPAVTIDSGVEALHDGDFQNAVFDFSSTGPVSLQISVTPAAGYFESFGPSSLPTTPPPTTPVAPVTPATPGAPTTPTKPGKSTPPATPTGSATPKH